MPIAIDFTGDFSQIVDTLEPITINRQAGGTVAIPLAWRFSRATSELQVSEETVVVTDTIWQFEWPAAEAPLELGDELVDSTSTTAVVQRIEHPAGTTRLRVMVRHETG